MKIILFYMSRALGKNIIFKVVKEINSFRPFEQCEDLFSEEPKILFKNYSPGKEKTLNEAGRLLRHLLNESHYELAVPPEKPAGKPFRLDFGLNLNYIYGLVSMKCFCNAANAV